MRHHATVVSVRGVLITFEGVEGSGKTTQMARLESDQVELERRPYNIREAIELYLEDCRDAGDPIPTEAGKEFIEVEAA